MGNFFKSKKNIIILSVILAVILAVTAALTCIIISKNNKTNNSKVQDSTATHTQNDAPTSSEPQTSSQPEASDKAESSNPSDTSTSSEKNPQSSNDETTFPEDDIADDDLELPPNDDIDLDEFFKKRPEKNVKSYPIVDEFFVPHYQKKDFKDSKTGKTLRYCLYLPEDYSKSKKYPVLLFMHGTGSVGTDYLGATNAIKPAFKNSGDILKSAIIVAPQAPDTNGFWPIDNRPNDEGGWGGIAMRLLLDVEKNYSCDLNRIYVTGNSMGGHGTWNLLETYSDHFAAGIPICGWGNPLKAGALKNIPIWIYHGAADTTVPVESSRTMYNAIKNAGGTKIHYTELSGVNHDSWTPAYESRELFSWLFSQNKETNPNSDYDIIPILTIKDSNGNIIISEKDTTYISYTTVSDTDCIELNLTEKGAKKLETAYKKYANKTFTVYYGNRKIMSFTASSGTVNKKFYIVGVFESYDYYEYIDRINTYGNP